MDRLNPTITELSQAIEQQAEKCPQARRLSVGAASQIGPLAAFPVTPCKAHHSPRRIPLGGARR
jgi:hypothetical protein